MNKPQKYRIYDCHLASSRLRLSSQLAAALTLAAVMFATLASGVCAADHPNVLLLIADDLRPQLGCYGDPIVVSPHLDRFAQTAVRFDRAYVQQAVCSPSRNSFLSGLRPGTTGLRGFGRRIRNAVPDVVTLPQHFKNHGYHSVGIGKVFHVYAETGLGSEDDPESWSQPLYLPRNPVWGPEQSCIRQRLIEEARQAGRVFKHSHDWPRAETWDAPDVPDDALRDGETAKKAVAFLQDRANKPAKPFFLAVGFYLPHLPFVAPRRYWDLYRPEDVVLPTNQKPPEGAPSWTVNHGFVRNYLNMPEPDAIDDVFKRRYLQAYLACISYVDACAGRVLDALQATGLAENTIVVVIGDHGYLMGEYGSWGHKHCNYETATRAPLLIRIPGMKTTGQETTALVEFVDLYPTLADAAGLPAPKRTDGISLVPLLDDPNRPWKLAAYSEMPRGEKLGGSVRTEHYRYVEWSDKQGRIVAQELYDHRADDGECRNVANDPTYGDTVADLSRLLHGPPNQLKAP